MTHLDDVMKTRQRHPSYRIFPPYRLLPSSESDTLWIFKKYMYIPFLSTIPQNAEFFLANKKTARVILLLFSLIIYTLIKLFVVTITINSYILTSSLYNHCQKLNWVEKFRVYSSNDTSWLIPLLTCQLSWGYRVSVNMIAIALERMYVYPLWYNALTSGVSVVSGTSLVMSGSGGLCSGSSAPYFLDAMRRRRSSHLCFSRASDSSSTPKNCAVSRLI